MTGAGLGLAATALPVSRLLAADYNPQETLSGNAFVLDIGHQKVNFTGRTRMATTVNGSLPAPTLRWKEGEEVFLRVRNNLAEDTSIHWHGMILPYQMDGVPGISFAGIKPGEHYDYSFKVQQSGTYWYHGHSGFQEQTGLYGAIIIDPKDGDPVQADRDYVLVLSDWTDEDPDDVYAKLKKQSHYYNINERTAGDLWRDIREHGVAETFQRRQMWNEMRMPASDISDVTGMTYTFLMNGFTPEQQWTALFNKGETIRLRIINASAMTFFDMRIPGLKMRVIAADGQPVEPVSVDEFRIGVAETYDVLVEPETDMAYAIYAQAMDRSGFACGALTANADMKPQIPELEEPPLLSMMDMGMAHDMGGQQEMDHSSHQMDHSKMSHDGHQMPEQPSMGQGPAGLGSDLPVKHADTESGPHIDMKSESPQYRLDDPGVGLRERADNNIKVLTYADLKHRDQTPDPREPDRELQLHLTGNMNRYMWSIDGVAHNDAEPLRFHYGERLRITFINDTMMNHPMHLHGMWSDLETGDPDHIPRKHTVIAQPGSKTSMLVTVDAMGDWAFHCHMLYHMLGMFREVQVRK